MNTLVEPYRVKGGSIRSKLLYINETFGAEAEAALTDFLVGRGISVVLEANWYDYDDFDAVLMFIAERYFAGDVHRLEEVGRFSARHALTTTYEVYLARRCLYAFLDRLSQLHLRFYSIGTLTIDDRADQHCNIRLSGAPRYAESDIHVAAGFFTGAAELLGCQEVRCRVHRLPTAVCFDLRWSV